MNQIKTLATSALLVFILLVGVAVLGSSRTLSGNKHSPKQSVDTKPQKAPDYLLKEMVYENIEITDLKSLPAGTVLKIQQLKISFDSPSSRGLRLTIVNGRLKFPYSDPLVFEGTIEEGNLNFNVYSKSMDVSELAALFPQWPALRKLTGLATKIDLYIKGKLGAPEFSGQGFANEISRTGFSIQQVPFSFDIKLTGPDENRIVSGLVRLGGGTISTGKVPITLDPSRIIFPGRPSTINLELYGTTKVEGVNIIMTLRGTLDEPSLYLTSEPPRPKDELLLMLATGVGLSDLHLQYDEQTRGIGLKKSLTNQFGLGYGIEESQVDLQNKNVTQSFQGEYKMTDTLSVELERKLNQEYQQSQPLPKEQAPDDTIMLKYQKGF